MSKILVSKDGEIIGSRPENMDRSQFIASFTGCCSMLRKQSLEIVGVYPNDFFRQGEESCLALRLLDEDYYCFLEVESIMYHEPSPVGRNLNTFMYYELRNKNKTALRYWPFPWAVIRPLSVALTAFVYGLRSNYLTLPFILAADFFRELKNIPSLRKPVKTETYIQYRKLTTLSKQKY
jgi:GT2 family glycosyltransferase